MEFSRFQHVGPRNSPVQVFECVDVAIRDCSFNDNSSNTNVLDLQTCRNVSVNGNMISGDSSGINVTRCDYAKIRGNTLVGRWARAESTGRSVRGVKAFGCAHVLICENHVSEYESPIKVESCGRYLVQSNYVLNSGLRPFTGQIALNISSVYASGNMHSGIVSGNIVENCGGVGIGISSDKYGQCVVSGNVVSGTGSNSLFLNVDGCIVSSNQFIDWDTLKRGAAAVAVPGKHIAVLANNAFRNDVAKDSPTLSPSGVTVKDRA